MKLRNLICVLMIVSTSLHAQTASEVFTNPKMTWYGVDCTQLKCVGMQSEWGTLDALKNVNMAAWNEKIIMEPKKYDVAKFYNKQYVDYKIEKSVELNNKVDEKSLVSMQVGDHKITESQIEKIVLTHKDETNTGLGLLYIAETFNKVTQSGIIHTVFFQPSTGKIYMIKTLESEAAGFGLSNYWLKTIYRTMEKSNLSWSKWKKEAGVK